MQVITCLFYAVASFTLGAIAYATTGQLAGTQQLMVAAQYGSLMVMIGGPLLFVAAAAIQRDHLTSR